MTLINSIQTPTDSATMSFDTEAARHLVTERINELSPELKEKVNKHIHDNPELAYQEHIAHETTASYLESLSFRVKRKAYGLDTSFEASLGEGGRQVVFCAEYDALPGIGHGCGHNLIATSSIAAFLGTAHTMSKMGIPGRLRILGTPAEESSGGKIELINKGAFNPPEDVALALMAHPITAHEFESGGVQYDGVAGLRLYARLAFKAEFHGKPAHAAGEPWNGVNALDAAVAAYSSVAMLRQQIRPDERIHAIIEDGGVAVNIIPQYSRTSWYVRAPTIIRAQALQERVQDCISAAAKATGCTLDLTTYVAELIQLRCFVTDDYLDLLHTLTSERMMRCVMRTSSTWPS